MQHQPLRDATSAHFNSLFHTGARVIETVSLIPINEQHRSLFNELHPDATHVAISVFKGRAYGETVDYVSKQLTAEEVIIWTNSMKALTASKPRGL